jgi:hypothetical protein
MPMPWRAAAGWSMAVLAAGTPRRVATEASSRCSPGEI